MKLGGVLRPWREMLRVVPMCNIESRWLSVKNNSSLAKYFCGLQYLNIRINMRGREWIEERTSSKSITVSQPSEDFVGVKPNFFGVGLNLNAAWRKFRKKI